MKLVKYATGYRSAVVKNSTMAPTREHGYRNRDSNSELGSHFSVLMSFSLGISNPEKFCCFEARARDRSLNVFVEGGGARREFSAHPFQDFQLLQALS